MAWLRAHIHQNPPAAVKNARTRAETRARLKRAGAAEGADAIAGVRLSFIVGLPIERLKTIAQPLEVGNVSTVIL